MGRFFISILMTMGSIPKAKIKTKICKEQSGSQQPKRLKYKKQFNQATVNFFQVKMQNINDRN